jgi:hypothetical protein
MGLIHYTPRTSRRGWVGLIHYTPPPRGDCKSLLFTKIGTTIMAAGASAAASGTRFTKIGTTIMAAARWKCHQEPPASLLGE